MALLPLLGILVLSLSVLALTLVLAWRPPKVSRSRRKQLLDESQQETKLFTSTESIERMALRVGGGPTGRLAGMLELARIRRSVSDIIVIVFAAVLVVLALGVLLGQPLLGLLAALLVPALAYLYISHKAGTVRKNFANSLDEALQVIASSLKAGYSLVQAVTMLAENSDEPIKSEFTRIVNQSHVGIKVYDSMVQTAERMHSEDFYWVAQAVAINTEVGGNLSEVLEGVSKTIKERAALGRQVRSLSAEGKMSAVIISLLPFLIIAVVSIMNPSYMAALYTTLPGMAISGVALVMLTVGILWMRSIIKLRY